MSEREREGRADGDDDDAEEDVKWAPFLSSGICDMTRFD